MIREDRYIVIKRNRLTADEEIAIRKAMPARSCVNGVVVEHDWPEYEPVWATIEARVIGADRPCGAMTHDADPANPTGEAGASNLPNSDHEHIYAGSPLQCKECGRSPVPREEDNELRKAAQELRDELLMRGVTSKHGVIVFSGSNDRWVRFCEALNVKPHRHTG